MMLYIAAVNEFSYVEDETSNVSFAINVTDQDHPRYPGSLAKRHADWLDLHSWIRRMR